MRLNLRATCKVLMSAALLLPIMVVSTGAYHARAEGPDTPVIAVFDATTQSQCTAWRHTPSNVVPCPAGSVIYATSTTLAAAQAAHHDYVVITSDPAAVTRDVDAKVHQIQQSAAPASVTPLTCLSGPFQDGGSYYDGGQGNKLSFQVKFTAGGGGGGSPCTVSGIQDREIDSASYDRWAYMQVGSDQGTRWCSLLSTSNWTGWNTFAPTKNYNSLYVTTSYDNDNCAWPGTRATGSTYLT